ncbi:HpcH/HpaI aldolase/citrate lyase family protein [Schumannella sp. 10F1B-5-1]|uniref:HpcH/HpaI aldolase family protein n=1 Tax=Schumannella sp. 10F1B-5-1 TaxID=2590780 RepID=UPI0011323EE8|nr:aldolase/citrate lyase family protein [Schumannella sp. 10F1B-5-1]TPW78248.1 2,4-dihydroxyhept-2-ene-1,7-dioic acid aldolase [Schumannella sp. 10F1B-5-1]
MSADTAALLDGPSLGVWVKLPTIASIEILAHAGADFVVIDLEHTLLSLETAAGMIALADAAGVAPLVRVPDSAPATIQRVLDAGAAGVLVPHVDSVEDARAAVRACRFPPKGSRGAGSTGSAGRWGTLRRADYLRFGNEQVLCIPQLESGAAIAAAGEIAAVDGVDAVFLGAADLTLDVGPEADVPALLASARAAALAAGTPVGSAGASAMSAHQAFDAGDAFFVAGNDASLLATASIELIAAARPATR